MKKGEIGVILLFSLALIAIVAINFASSCKVPDENKCGIDTTSSEQMVPVCEYGLGQPVCKKVSEVCGETNCPVGQTIDYCDYKNKKWICKDSTSSPNTSDILCKITDNTLPYPRAWGNKIQEGDPDAMKPDSNFTEYKEIRVSGVPGCQLTKCKDGFKVYNDSSFCVPSDLGNPCNTDMYKQSPNDSYKGYPDPNAEWIIDYKYPDSNTKYCKYNKCAIGYVFDPNTNKCIGSSNELPSDTCGTPPKNATKYRCRKDGFVVDECKSPYTITKDLKGCELVTCPNPNARPENNCILSPTNLDDIKAVVYGNQPMGQDETAILENAASNGNVYLTSDGDLKAKAPNIENPWGGCGNKSLPGFVTDEDGKCVEAFVGSGFKFNPVGSDKPGCVECPPLVCPLNAKDTGTCKNFMEGCTRVELSGGDSWAEQCKYDKSPPLGYGWGDLQDGYLPIECVDPPCGVDTMKVTLHNNAWQDRVWVRIYDERNKTYIGSETKLDPKGTSTKTFLVPRFGGGICVTWESTGMWSTKKRSGYVNNTTVRSWCGDLDANGNCKNSKKGLWTGGGRSFVVSTGTPCPQ